MCDLDFDRYMPFPILFHSSIKLEWCITIIIIIKTLSLILPLFSKHIQSYYSASIFQKLSKLNDKRLFLFYKYVTLKNEELEVKTLFFLLMLKSKL